MRRRNGLHFLKKISEQTNTKEKLFESKRKLLSIGIVRLFALCKYASLHTHTHWRIHVKNVTKLFWMAWRFRLYNPNNFPVIKIRLHFGSFSVFAPSLPSILPSPFSQYFSLLSFSLYLFHLFIYPSIHPSIFLSTQ